MNRHRLSLWHPDTDQCSLRLQEFQRLFIALVRRANDHNRVRAAAVVRGLLDGGLELLIVVFHKIEELFGATFFAQSFLVRSIDGDDAEPHHARGILDREVAQPAPSTTDDDPIAGLCAGLL